MNILRVSAKVAPFENWRADGWAFSVSPIADRSMSPGANLKMEQSRFTEAQRAAAGHIAGNFQLIACAGSGKTEVVAQLVVNLLRPEANGGAGCTPENVVAFTFTDKAATELRGVLDELKVAHASAGA